jgi:hypothetical protein
MPSALDGCDWSALCPGRLTPGEDAPGTLWIKEWVGLKTDLDILEEMKIFNLPGIEPQLLECPARRVVTIPTTLSPLQNLKLLAKKACKILHVML